jgi:sigma-B regulation protein RsbU (phosphoserine phosphatase)
MSRHVQQPPTRQQPLRTGRWWNLLPVRLALAVNLAAIIVLGSFWLVDYRRTRAAYLTRETERLREEARVLRVAQRHFERAPEFQRFVDRFCQQMGVAASPGHHIAVLDPKGNVIVRAHERASRSLEARLSAHRDEPVSRFVLEGTEFISVSVPGDSDSRIAVAQSLAPIHRVIRAQARSRAFSLGILAVVILVVTSGVTVIWVHEPLRRLVNGLRAVGEGRFDVRIEPHGSTELRYLAEGVNDMAATLERVDRGRRSQMRRARNIQARLLPTNGRSAGGFMVVAAFQPADSVGGDFYDVFRLPDGSTLVTVLDVSGHGVAAALHTALLRTVLHYESRSNSDPAAIATAMNREFASVADSGEFATCLLVRLHDNGDLEYVSAGHDPAAIVNRDGSVRLLSAGGLPLGVLPVEHYASESAKLGCDERLYMYTDGLYEISRPDGTLFGRDRFIELVAELVRGGSDAPETVVAHIQPYARNDHFEDDVTLLCVKRK